jgi:hypothetical protein
MVQAFGARQRVRGFKLREGFLSLNHRKIRLVARRTAPKIAFSRFAQRINMNACQRLITVTWSICRKSAGQCDRGGYWDWGARRGRFDRHGSTIDDVVRSFPDSTRAQVYECLAYYEDHRAEIDSLVARQMSSEL